MSGLAAPATSAGSTILTVGVVIGVLAVAALAYVRAGMLGLFLVGALVLVVGLAIAAH